MAKSRKRKNRKFQPPPRPQPPPPERPLYFLLAPVLLAVLVFFTYKSQGGYHQIIPISIIALITGVIFEYRSISGKWIKVFWHSVIALLLSLFIFLPFKREHVYNVDDHITLWPYAFIAGLSLIAIAFEQKKASMQLTEGITLLQSLAIIYWVVDYGFLENARMFLGILMIGGLLFALYALFHALTPTPHSPNSRLALSIWSSIIFILLTIDNIYRVYQNELIEQTTELADGLYIALQYFLLGVSAIYLVQNILMLINFMPTRNKGFSEEYHRDVKKLKAEHVSRFSPEQMGLVPALICIFFAATIFTLNYYYHFLPRHTLIWIMFFLFPYLMKIPQIFFLN